MKRWNYAKFLMHEFYIAYDGLFNNSRLKLFEGKLRLKWCGLFVVSNMYPRGAIELEDFEKKKYVVNGQ